MITTILKARYYGLYAVLFEWQRLAMCKTKLHHNNKKTNY